MNIGRLLFDTIHLSGGGATCPLAPPCAHLPLSRLVVGRGLPPRCFALKNSDPLQAEVRVESNAGATPTNASSGVSNYGS